MALKPQGIPEIPPETVRAAHAVFPKGNIYIFLRDRLGTIYQDDLFADLYPKLGRPTYSRLSSRADHGLPVHGEFNRPSSG